MRVERREGEREFRVKAGAKGEESRVGREWRRSGRVMRGRGDGAVRMVEGLRGRFGRREILGLRVEDVEIRLARVRGAGRS